jgi:hypothetical protein
LLSKTNSEQIESYVEDKTLLVIYTGNSSPKSNEINQGLTILALKNQGYVIAKPQFKNKRVIESLTGITAADFQCKFLIIASDCLEKISSDLKSVKSIGELIYLCRKSTALEHSLELTTQATPMSYSDIVVQKYPSLGVYVDFHILSGFYDPNE